MYVRVKTAVSLAASMSRRKSVSCKQGMDGDIIDRLLYKRAKVEQEKNRQN
jgi:hypothetical protein